MSHPPLKMDERDTPRALLTSEEMLKLIAAGRHTVSMDEAEAASKVNTWFQAKIASGELMVVVSTTIDEVRTSDGIFFECRACGVDYPTKDHLSPGEFCRCGSKIVEEARAVAR